MVYHTNSIRGCRINVIEDLLTSYNTHLKVITEDPEEVIAENVELKKMYDQLLQDKQQYEKNITTITHENNELKQQIKELTKQIQTKEDTINNTSKELKEKAVTEEKLKNSTLTIDNLNKKLEENSKQYEETIKELKQQITTKEDKIEDTNKQYKQLLQDNKEEIKNITKEHEEKITSILHDNKEEIKQLTAYTIKLNEDINNLKDTLNNKNNYIKDIKNLNPIDRLLKKYPEEEAEEVKQLPLIENDTH